MARSLPNIVEKGYRGKIGEPKPPVSLAGLRTPGARYREIRPPQPVQDPLLEADTCFPRRPDPYRVAMRYPILGRRPYVWPLRYEPHDAEWEYEDVDPDDAGDEAMFDGRALRLFDRQPREHIPTYEDGLLSPGESEELLRQAAAEACEVSDWPSMRSEVPPGESDGIGGAFAGDATAPLDRLGGQETPTTMESRVQAPGDAPSEPAHGGLERLVLGDGPEDGPSAAAAWPSMGGDVFRDDVAAAEHAFDQPLEDMARDFGQQEQAFAEPDWGPSALVPEPADPGPPEPPDPFLQPPSPPGLGRFPF